MKTMTLHDRISDELLPRVQQPGQYIGKEWNQLVAPGDWATADLRIAIGFPDTYTIGMSHLGCQIIYWLCNHTPGVCAERVFVPRPDAAAVMRERDIPLFTWDTRQPVREADILAVSLQYEMAFTNPDGSFRVDGVAPGSYQLECRQGGHEGQTLPFRVQAGETAEVSFSLRPTR